MSSSVAWCPVLRLVHKNMQPRPAVEARTCSSRCLASRDPRTKGTVAPPTNTAVTGFGRSAKARAHFWLSRRIAAQSGIRNGHGTRQIPAPWGTRNCPGTTHRSNARLCLGRPISTILQCPSERRLISMAAIAGRRPTAITKSGQGGLRFCSDSASICEKVARNHGFPNSYLGLNRSTCSVTGHASASTNRLAWLSSPGLPPRSSHVRGTSI